MSDQSMKALQGAVEDHLGEDDSATVTVVPRNNGPEMALIRADVLEALKLKAAQFDAGNDEEIREDALTLLSKE